MDSIILLINGEFKRFKRGKNLRRAHFERIIDATKYFGATGWYEDSKETFEFIMQNQIKWEDIPVITIENDYD